MGIKGLLPYLKCITKEISLSQIRGSVVAVDTYCWLHKSAITCSDKIALGEDTDLFLKYCLKYIKLLLLYDIKIILIFDGKNLPAKLGVENKRYENRENYRKKGMQLTLEKKLSEAKECFDRCIEISHNIAVKLIKEAHKLGVKCIVAPYEADAQLAYLGIKNLVDYVITEDSDLLLFGTPKVLFKLDFNGRAYLIEKNDINKALKFPMEKYSFDKFRYMGIISGCDYFSGINGVGLITAAKMILKTHTIGLADFLTRINMYTNSKIFVTKEEINLAVKADLTFQFQIVFDPITGQQVPLNNYPIGMKSSDLQFAGEIIADKDLVFQLAIGQRDPTNHELVPNYELDSKLQMSTHTFDFGVVKKSVGSTDLSRRKTTCFSVQRGKSLQVKCSFPWKDASISMDEMLNLSSMIDTYSTDNETREVKKDLVALSDNSDEEVCSLLNGVLGKEEQLLDGNNVKNEVVNPFSRNSIIRSKRSILEITSKKENISPYTIVETIKKPKLSMTEESEPALNSKKILVQSRLSHLFKK